LPFQKIFNEKKCTQEVYGLLQIGAILYLNCSKKSRGLFSKFCKKNASSIKTRNEEHEEKTTIKELSFVNRRCAIF